METILYPQFQAEVDDLPKVNGKAGPAELYNWSVKPDRCVVALLAVERCGSRPLT